jgi:hypothetical protein
MSQNFHHGYCGILVHDLLHQGHVWQLANGTLPADFYPYRLCIFLPAASSSSFTTNTQSFDYGVELNFLAKELRILLLAGDFSATPWSNILRWKPVTAGSCHTNNLSLDQRHIPTEFCHHSLVATSCRS